MGIIEAIRLYFADPIVDQKWIKREANPFEDGNMVLVIGVKDGWVQYRIKAFGHMLSPLSCKIETFKRVYRRRRPEEICPALN